MIEMLNTEEKAKLLDLLIDKGLQEKDINEIEPEAYGNNRVIAVVYQAILNDSV
jgi:hypothetical protein